MRNTGIFLLILYLVVNLMAYPFINIALIAIFEHRFLQLSREIKADKTGDDAGAFDREDEVDLICLRGELK